LEAYDVTTDMASSTIHEPGIDSPLAEVSSSGTLTFYHQDWLGNVVMLTNAAGAKVQTYTYDVWGKGSGFDSAGAAITPGSFASRFLFTGREYDPETALYHYRARAYSPTLGRFLQTDPIDFDAGDVNLFRYVGNNPMNWVDPLGLRRGTTYDLCRTDYTCPLDNYVYEFVLAASDVSAGFGDVLSFSLTSRARDMMGTNDYVSQSSTGYGVGRAAGTLVSIARGTATAKAVGSKAINSMTNKSTLPRGSSIPSN